MIKVKHLTPAIASLVIVFLLPIEFYAQKLLQGTVKGYDTQEALSYCNISIVGSTKSTITNEEGKFSIRIDSLRDSLSITYLGYQSKVVSASELFKNHLIWLQPKDYSLPEVSVRTEDYAYELLNECKKRLRTYDTEQKAKVYFGLETSSENRPIELVECYFNGQLEGLSIESLLLKNGRIAWAPLDHRLFVSLSTSKAIRMIDLTRKNVNFPAIPFQFSKWRMKRLFNARIVHQNGEYYCVKFWSRKEDKDHFEGKAWIDKANSDLHKIRLIANQVKRHPFLPLAPSDQLNDVSFDITQTYKYEAGNVKLNHINFKYQVQYVSKRDTSSFVKHASSHIERPLTSKGVIYFYDYGDPFILPFFDYDATHDDYRKISFIPYNPAFWAENNKLLLTSEQKRKLGFFAEKGHLMRYRSTDFNKKELQLRDNKPLYETNNIFWSPNKRIFLKQHILRNEEYTKDYRKQVFQKDLYDLKVQILLDVTNIEDSLTHRSFTVLDAFNTFYHLPESKYTNCFINLYFDICETIRVKMERKLDVSVQSLSKIESIYKNTKASLQEITRRYIDETHSGKDVEAMSEWNQYVMDQLGINNFEIFGLEE